MSKHRARRLVAALAVVAWTAACTSGTGSVAEVTPAPKMTLPEPPPTAAPPTTAVVTVASASALPGDEGADSPVPRAARAPSRPQPLAVTGRIEIPKIGLNHTTYEGIALSVLDHGPSHWPGTPMPGSPGNTVFPGHRVTHSRPFFDLDKVAVGDQVIFTTSAGRFTYSVTETLIVGADALWITNSSPEPTFTIFACHPKGSARQRIVVRGRLLPAAPPPPAAPTPAAPAPATTTTTAPCLLCTLLNPGR